MRIVIIHGQTHKGTSYHIGKWLIKKLGEKSDVDEYFLPRDMPEFCCGCYNCIIRSEECCPHYDILKPITSSIDESDLIIFTTPVYCMRTTGAMKSLLDHYFSRWMNHKPNEKMFYKRAVIIAIGAGGGMKKATKDIKTSLDNWGISNIYTYRSASMAMKWEEVAQKRKIKYENDITKLAARIKRTDKINTVSKGKKFHFMCMRFMQLKGWGIPQDKKYWKAKGWLEDRRPW